MGNGGFEDIYKLKVMRGGRSNPSFVLAGEELLFYTQQAAVQ